MDDNEMVLVDEHKIGTCQMTKEFEESFLKSCEHNGTTPDDLEYFRSYIWNLFAMMIQKMNNDQE
jgi:hypothetical protein